MATPDTRFFTIPEADTIKVAKAVAQLTELPDSKMIRIKNVAPWQPDAVRFSRHDIVVSRMYAHEGDRYLPTSGYRITGGSSLVNAERLTAEEITRLVKEKNRSLLDIIIRLPRRFAPRNDNS